MNKPKIIFFDIDGTLVDMKVKRISPRTLETLKRLQQNDVRICIATGRPVVMLPKFEGLEFDAYLTFNGSYCFDKKGVIFSNPIPGDDVQKIIANAAAVDKPVIVASADKMLANGTEPRLEEYMAFANEKVYVSSQFESELEKDIYQMMAAGTVEEYDALLKNTKNAKIAAWWDKAVDLIPADGGKGVAVRAILSHYGIDVTESMAFGDANNDLEMIEAVGWGVAMGNGSAEIKALADDICGDVSEDGIYHYCLENKFI